MEFKTEDTKDLILIYRVMPVFFSIMYFVFIILDIKENGALNTKDWLIVISLPLLFIVTLTPSFKSALYSVTFKDEGFEYERLFARGFVYYEDIRDLVYVKVKGHGGYYYYTVEVIRHIGRPLRFSTTHLKLGAENKFKEEWEKRTNKIFRRRKGHLLF